jgi:hypothetical protein
MPAPPSLRLAGAGRWGSLAEPKGADQGQNRDDEHHWVCSLRYCIVPQDTYGTHRYQCNKTCTNDR